MNTELLGIDGKPFEFEWNVLQVQTTMGIFHEVQTRMTVRLEEFKDRIIFMSMFNNIDWTRNGYYKECHSNSEMERDQAKKFSLGHLGEEENWYGTQNYKLEGQWNSIADVMVANLLDSGHPFFGASCALDRGLLRKKGGRCRSHFDADPSNAELVFSHDHFCKSAQYLRSNRGLV